MKRTVALALFFMSAISLTACGPIYSTTYEYIPPHSHFGKMCIMQCMQMKQMCQNTVSMQYNQCQSSASMQGNIAYQAYVVSQQQQNLPITKSPSDFVNNWSCSNDSNACDSNYNQCYNNCGGQIIPHSRCVAFCDKNVANRPLA